MKELYCLCAVGSPYLDYLPLLFSEPQAGSKLPSLFHPRSQGCSCLDALEHVIFSFQESLGGWDIVLTCSERASHGAMSSSPASFHVLS
ncbi:hypothetical protein FJTKL_03637 [Diaporthe vaccinii]|uniref:Uncharacterized protein n=1 Tax=Diaporthe vaccinii TaxID=105482 RepID=A0ABR4DW38_9PEZI